MPERPYRVCDLCGAVDPEPVLASDRLDGPLVRCRECGLFYVGRRERDYTFSGADPARSDALARRVESLGIVDHEVEAAEEPWRRLVHEDRLARLRRHVDGGRLLDVGCSTGAFMAAAAEARFEVEGVEPDPVASARAREELGLRVVTGTLEEAGYPDASFDAAVLLHTVEHLDSPRRMVTQLQRVFRPGGVLAVETPAIDGLPFRFMRGRWRQLIPGHYFFFDRATLVRLLSETGYDVLEVTKVGKPVSMRFLADRVRRMSPAAGRIARRAVVAARLEIGPFG